jgi:hypothetical protein
MSHSFIIEVGGKAVGLVHRYDGQEPFRFIASDRRLCGLEGQSFSKPARAEAAARACLMAQRKSSAIRSRRVPFTERALHHLNRAEGLFRA